LLKRYVFIIVYFDSSALFYILFSTLFIYLIRYHTMFFMFEYVSLDMLSSTMQGEKYGGYTVIGDLV